MANNTKNPSPDIRQD